MAARRPSSRGRFDRLKFPVRGRRVELVLPSLGHVPSVARLLNEPTVARWSLHIPYPYQEQDARTWVRKSNQGRRAGRFLGLTIVRRSDGAVLGGVALHHLEPGGSSAEVGYWIGRPYRGHGYATEAVNVLVRTGFARLGLHRMEARIFPANLSSRRVAKRCGFRFEGRLRDEVQKDGRWRATLLFSRLSTDPSPRT